jgi:hypothetical protein
MSISGLRSNRGDDANPPAHHRCRAATVAAALVLADAAMMRLRGYPIGTNVVVSCRQRHLFTTIWLPGGSLKAIRLGWWRFQRCPVGHHWSLVTPIRTSELTDAQRRIAAGHRDVRIP